MSNQSDTANTEAASSSSVTNSNMSVSDFVFNRTESLRGPEPVTEPDLQTEQQEQEPEEQQFENETDPENQSELDSGSDEAFEADEAEDQELGEEDVLSQQNLENLLNSLSEEQAKEFGGKLGSKSLTRFGQLTKKAKTESARADKAEKELAELKSVNTESESLLDRPSKVQNNPLSEISSIEGLEEKREQAEMIVEWAEDIEDASSGTSPDEIITTLGEKDMTLSDVRKLRRENQKVLRKYIPAQEKVVKLKQKHAEIGLNLDKKANELFPWVGSKEQTPQREKFVSFMGIPAVQKALSSSTELSSILPYILSHAADSISRHELGGDTKPKAGKKFPTLKPSKSTMPTASISDRAQGTSSKKLNALNQAYSKSGSTDDYVALRTKQLEQEWNKQ